jgi:hypothetical protein
MGVIRMSPCPRERPRSPTLQYRTERANALMTLGFGGVEPARWRAADTRRPPIVGSANLSATTVACTTAFSSWDLPERSSRSYTSRSPGQLTPISHSPKRRYS